MRLMLRAGTGERENVQKRFARKRKAGAAAGGPGPVTTKRSDQRAVPPAAPATGALSALRCWTYGDFAFFLPSLTVTETSGVTE